MKKRKIAPVHPGEILMFEFLEPLPVYEKDGHQHPMTDYEKILERINIRHPTRYAL